jgi:hypothetical protein
VLDEDGRVARARFSQLSEDVAPDVAVRVRVAVVDWDSGVYRLTGVYPGYEGEFDGGSLGMMCPDGGCRSRTRIRSRIRARVSREEAGQERLDVPSLLGGAEVGIVAVVVGGFDQGSECWVFLGLG